MFIMIGNNNSENKILDSQFLISSKWFEEFTNAGGTFNPIISPIVVKSDATRPVVRLSQRWDLLNCSTRPRNPPRFVRGLIIIIVSRLNRQICTISLRARESSRFAQSQLQRGQGLTYASSICTCSINWKTIFKPLYPRCSLPAAPDWWQSFVNGKCAIDRWTVATNLHALPSFPAFFLRFPFVSPQSGKANLANDAGWK